MTDLAAADPTLVYIGGYGHSGSTLLEYLLTGCADLVACGEVHAANGAPSTRKCTCGSTVAQCPVWNFVADPSLDVARWSHAALEARLLDQVLGSHAGIVDSSKTAWGHAFAPFRQRNVSALHLVHIVRDPRAVCWSLLMKDRRTETRSNDAVVAVRTVLGWLYANLACELFARRYPTQYLRIRYEDLAADPVAMMPSVLQATLPSAQWNANNVGKLENRHQLYGNRMRRRSLQVDTIEVDDKWKTDLPRRIRRSIEVISWFLRARYGYS